MIIDSHQHFYRYDPDEYGWITEEMGLLRRDHLPDELHETLERAGTDRCIAVQARQTVEETDWLLQLAAEHSFIAGVVGWVPLVKGAAVAEELRRFLHRGAALKGVRHVLQAEPDSFFDDAKFNEGLREVTHAGLTYDLLITEKQLLPALSLVSRHPEQVFVIDHLAKPIVDGSPSDAWRRGISEFARFDRVSCKLSGLVTEAPEWKWTPALLQPYVDVLLQAFGPERVLFGSDWPVCRLGCAYATWLDFVKTSLTGFTLAERAAVLGGNANRVYRLEGL